MNIKVLLKCFILVICIICIALLLVISHSSEEAPVKNDISQNVIQENEKAYFQSEIQKKQTGSTRMIRVLLLDSDYKSNYQESIQLQIQGTYLVNNGVYGEALAGQIVEITGEHEWFRDNHIWLSPSTEQDTITINSIERALGHPSYHGTLHIYKNEQGLWLVNELPLETYLTAVVPSEMPSYYAPEALKAQAVCARTYAAVHMQRAELESFHADVDDSVAYQVYQNYAATSETIAAVEATAGQIMMQNGSPVNAYYFSTSHGETSTDQVWEAAVPAAHLQNVECLYDQEEPWYQWEVTFTQAELNAAVKRIYPEITQVNHIEVTKRDDAGTAIMLTITTDKGDVLIENEYDIRSTLSPYGLVITRQDGSQVNGSSLLPSAYFTVEAVENNGGKEYHINGGGFGHGVGMSQNGAQNMAEEGMTYQEILHYFYKDVEITSWEE